MFDFTSSFVEFHPDIIGLIEFLKLPSLWYDFTMSMYILPEAKTYSCFCELMKRMCNNFPHGGAMDTHFANMRSLIQVW